MATTNVAIPPHRDLVTARHSPTAVRVGQTSLLRDPRRPLERGQF